ncbi:hypothetical protein ACHAQJ_003547 [Trichoderma viride]
MPTNTGRRMLPLQALLNSTSPDPFVTSSRQSGPVLTASSTSLPTEALRDTTGVSLVQKAKLPTNVVSMTKPKPQGSINFPPFEDIEEASYQEMCRFRVSPFGQIRQSCQHIPYNSSKKDFFEKTGRESIEVFKYEFRFPGEDKSYTVMWDYNVGLVHMTPFFKCLRYSKTTPSQMLSQNPGLREISPSVTGGAVSAQGYWMPYKCAEAVCATFCDKIAGALIPLFGPTFPSRCTPTPLSSPHCRDMVISQQIIFQETENVERFRHGQKSRIIKVVGEISNSLRAEGYALRGKRGSQATFASILPSNSHSSWTPINRPNSSHRPMAVSVPSTACEKHEVNNTLSRVSRSAVANRAVHDPNSSFQTQYAFLNGPPQTETGESEKNMMEKWGSKRRRRAPDEVRTMPSSISRMEANGGERPQQELEHLRAAEVLLSFTRNFRDTASPSSLIVETSDDDCLERRHQRKRPKAHSF